MFPYSLLAVSEATTETVAMISVIAIAVLCVVIFVLALFRKSVTSTKKMVFAALSVALSFVLSYVKVSPVTYGGSITLASFVPILLYAYAFGFTSGLVTGLVYGILQFIQSPYILTPVTFLLDYALAFIGIAFAGIFGSAQRKKEQAGQKTNEMLSISLACVCAYAWRFLMHFGAGVIYFDLGAIWASLPANSAVAYSLLYQVVYLVPDFIICLAVCLLLVKRGIVSRLVEQMRK